VLYDVTSLYFEVQKEDEYRKPGLSKERRLEPQIIIGLLVDKNSFPLGLQSFEGNKRDQNHTTGYSGISGGAQFEESHSGGRRSYAQYQQP